MDVLRGVKVLEVSQYAYVPAAGATLGDWGADVIKVVHPVYGDVMYGAHASGLEPPAGSGSFMWEIANRNKRSIGIDLATEDGLEVLYALAGEADVFLTNFLAPARRKLRIDVEQIRTVNPSIVYARGTGQGPQGPDADAPGYDSVSFWARSGWANPLAESAGRFLYQPGAGCGDVMAGFALASGVVGALFKRDRTGETSIVDGSLLATGIWSMAGAIAASHMYGMDTIPIREKHQPGNALTSGYRTKDDRWILLSGIVHGDGFRDFAERVGRAWWLDDERFATHEARLANHLAFVESLDEAFAERTLAEWRVTLAGMELAWGVVQNTAEVAVDPQVVANGYVRESDGVRLTATPVQFDERPLDLRRAPQPGQHTEEILLELGRDWEDIARLKDLGAVT